VKSAIIVRSALTVAAALALLFNAIVIAGSAQTVPTAQTWNQYRGNEGRRFGLSGLDLSRGGQFPRASPPVRWWFGALVELYSRMKYWYAVAPYGVDIDERRTI